jgi:hypothetical protein
MAVRKRKNTTEEEKTINLRVPLRFLKKLDKHLETASPPLSAVAWYQ